MQVLSQSGTLQRVAISQEDVHIIANPLLDEDREECCTKTEHEGHEPKSVYTNVVGGWFESGECRGRNGRDRSLWGDGGNLLGNLCEDDDVLLEVVNSLVCGVDFQVLFTINDECGESSRK